MYIHIFIYNIYIIYLERSALNTTLSTLFTWLGVEMALSPPDSFPCGGGDVGSVSVVVVGEDMEGWEDAFCTSGGGEEERGGDP